MPRQSWLLVVLALFNVAAATETENQGISVLPAPGKVVVDAKAGDWDLSGGVFVCGDVENQREKFGVWIHSMYDAENLYLLARWIDETPLNNPGQVSGSYGFAGDCLQFRTITAQGTPQARGNHFTCWQDRDGRNAIFVECGTDFKEGTIKDAKSQGAQQAFLKNSDGRGYVQEIAIPWKLLTRDGKPLAAGGPLTFTVEPNFTIGAEGRLTLKDIFKPGITPDRVFTFMANTCWGPATLESHGKLAPRSVRLADGRQFPVQMKDGSPMIDWTGLIKTTERAGIHRVTFDMPEDGYASVNLVNRDGQVVSQLVGGEFRRKGKQEILWDGLTTMNWRNPGDPLPAGTYTMRGLWHKGIGLRLVGWAANAGTAPWDSDPASNWGGDHGMPVACATAGQRVFLGWSGAEAGKALLACDLEGNVLWKNSRQGMAGAEFVAVDGPHVYAVNWGNEGANYVYRVLAESGSYAEWPDGSADLMPKDLFPDGKVKRFDGLAAGNNCIYLSLLGSDKVAVVDGKSRKLLHTWSVAKPRHLAVGGERLLYVVSAGANVVALDPQSGSVKNVITGLNGAQGVTIDAQGQIYVAVGKPENQVKVFSREGKFLRGIGRPGGRPPLGPWQPDGMAFAAGIALDRQGNLWVAEADMTPKRISVWNAETGKFVKEFFGPSTYGALGGAINPRDPHLIIGQGCEWRIPPATAANADARPEAVCLGVITREGMENSRFGIGNNGKLYLAVASGWAFDIAPVRIYERLGDANYKLRATFTYSGKEKEARTLYWADENGDGQEQPGEVHSYPGHHRFSGWYMNLAPDMTIYCGREQFRVAGFTGCGAPKYDLDRPTKLPAAGMGSADGRRLLTTGEYNVDRGWMDCYDIGSGKKLWSYADNFVGVHGSHKACPAADGMVRGSYGPCGVARLAAPIGNVWVLATNVGEWHILTEDGLYLTRLFQSDPMKIQWPEKALPGAVMDNTPPGMGGEDFGGSVCLAENGKLYVQAGKTGFWDLQVVGLETVRTLEGPAVVVSDDAARQAAKLREKLLQQAVGIKKLALPKKTISLTGNWDNDFAGIEPTDYAKQDSAAVRTRAAWDDQNLYLAWDVRDATPWLNAATAAEQMYTGGDTVDFQLATTPKSEKAADDAAAALRLSIGNFKGKPTAVLYRKTSAAKKPKDFSSGVVKQYHLDYVDIVPEAQIKVAVRPGSGYTVEAAIPLKVLGLSPAAGKIYRGDFGVTHGGPDNQRTRLRTYWNNQHTGIVDDVVFELMLEPENWGELEFKP